MFCSYDFIQQAIYFYFNWKYIQCRKQIINKEMDQTNSLNFLTTCLFFSIWLILHSKYPSLITPNLAPNSRLQCFTLVHRLLFLLHFIPFTFDHWQFRILTIPLLVVSTRYVICWYFISQVQFTLPCYRQTVTVSNITLTSQI